MREQPSLSNNHRPGGAVRRSGFAAVVALTLGHLLTGSILFAQWSTPVNVTRVASGFAWAASMVEDSTGCLHATWTNELPNSAVWIGYASKPANVDTWTIPVHLNRDSVLYRVATIGIGPGHVPYVVWMSEDENGHLYYTHRSGDTWTIPQHVPNWTQFGTQLRVTSDHQDRLHLVWSDHRVIWYARYEGAVWTRPETVMTYGTRGVYDPDIATDRQGFAHVVYSLARDTADYVRQTMNGWAEPQHLSNGAAYAGNDPRIRLDTTDWPNVIWADRLHVMFYPYVGDSWQAPEQVDSVWGGVLPSLCVDPWNQVHAFYYDNGRTLERTRFRGRWSAPQPVVDTMHHYVEAVADNEKLHVLIRAGSNWYYSFRPLSPPGIATPTEAPVVQYIEVPGSPVTPHASVAFSLNCPTRTLADIFDTSGRRVFHLNLGVLPTGKHEFSPFGYLPASGIYICRISAGKSAKTIKLVRID